MKKLGYPPRFAGALESAASTGGMLMPPIMGAGAFVMAEITGISYIQVAIAAMLGSCLYYFSLLIWVDFISRDRGLKGIGDEKILSWRQILRDTYQLIPIAGLVFMLLLSAFLFYAVLLNVIL